MLWATLLLLTIIGSLAHFLKRWRYNVKSSNYHHESDCLKPKNRISTLRALSYTQRNATPGATQVIFASFIPMQLSFSHPAPRCLNSKCTYTHLLAHGQAGLKMRCVQAHCWRIAILRHLKTIAPLTKDVMVHVFIPKRFGMGLSLRYACVYSIFFYTTYSIFFFRTFK